MPTTLINVSSSKRVRQNPVNRATVPVKGQPLAKLIAQDEWADCRAKMDYVNNGVVEPCTSAPIQKGNATLSQTCEQRGAAFRRGGLVGGGPLAKPAWRGVGHGDAARCGGVGWGKMRR